MTSTRETATATFLTLFVAACSGDSDRALAASQLGPNEEPAATQPTPAEPDGPVLRLEARLGSVDALLAEVTYKVIRERGELVKELEVEVEGAEPGRSHAISIDGVELGELRTDLDGEGDFGLAADARRSFPDGFREPTVGSVVRIGELGELRLEELVKLAQLEAKVRGTGLAGKAKFKVERLGQEVTREFSVELERGPAETEHEVRLDGVGVGTLALDDDGEGELEYAEAVGLAFPVGFPELRPGARLEIGELWSGELIDVLSNS